LHIVARVAAASLFQADWGIQFLIFFFWCIAGLHVKCSGIPKQCSGLPYVCPPTAWGLLFVAWLAVPPVVVVNYFWGFYKDLSESLAFVVAKKKAAQ
jgi:hypothetical protein